MDATTTAITAIVTPLVQMGLPGIAILGLGWWIYRQQRRIDDLTDKLMTITGEVTKALSDSASSSNRLADGLLRGKPE